MSIDTILSENIAFSNVSPMQLSAIITDAVQEAIEPLLDRIETLEATITGQAGDMADLRQQIAALEGLHGSLSDSLYFQLQQIKGLKEEIHPIPSEPTKKTVSHIDELHRLMIEEKTQQVSIAKGARLLDISKERMRLLKPLILKDGRFELSWSTIKGKKAVVIRIRKFL